MQIVTEIELLVCSYLIQLDFYWKLKVYKRNVDTPGELLANILDAATRIKQREDQLSRKTRDLRTPVGKCTEVDCGIFECLL